VFSARAVRSSGYQESVLRQPPNRRTAHKVREVLSEIFPQWCRRESDHWQLIPVVHEIDVHFVQDVDLIDHDDLDPVRCGPRCDGLNAGDDHVIVTRIVGVLALQNPSSQADRVEVSDGLEDQFFHVNDEQHTLPAGLRIGRKCARDDGLTGAGRHGQDLPAVSLAETIAQVIDRLLLVWIQFKHDPPPIDADWS